ncbi:hypothetical protein FD01_GL001893 [Lacticaseibacillus manihotivorans DSM 13343 = JCM 12514]|uniref:YopX protein domain-containing protein n=1 Tax=Lacticaseibacillus manihotivorans DSM 13343 = JCM 12514 TaxID=1423769 RepID=A0A0R1QDB2_9LACO|nr:hypothetical protein FD01_GL001893 [Lacticaseibacillus manihotivorans DSM 13343 = JCM 12514]
MYGIQDAYDTLSGHVKYDDGENACYDEDCFGGFLDNDRYVVEQFTGLKDKNGREIYEGDVLDCINGDINTSDKAFYPGRCMGQVGFVGASFIVWPRPVVDGHRMHYGCEALSDGLTKYTWENEIAAGESVVVGNVYANPELLEE